MFLQFTDLNVFNTQVLLVVYWAICISVGSALILLDVSKCGFCFLALFVGLPEALFELKDLASLKTVELLLFGELLV